MKYFLICGGGLGVFLLGGLSHACYLEGAERESILYIVVSSIAIVVYAILDSAE